MDLSSTIIGLVSVLAFVIPIALIIRASKAKQKKFLSSFVKLAQQQNISLSETEVWDSSYAIGIDSSAKALFYLKKRIDTEEHVAVNLSNMSSCKVLNSSRNVGGSTIVDAIYLVVSFKSPSEAEKRLEFYSSNHSASITDEPQLAQKWASMVNATVTANQ